EPAVAVRVLVDLLRRVGERLVDLDDLARERRDDIGDRLHRLDLGVRLILADRLADLRRVEEHDLAELVLGVPGDAEGGRVALDARPVVLGVVLEIVRVAALGHGQVSFGGYSGFARTSAARALPRTSISIAVPGSARSGGR